MSKPYSESVGLTILAMTLLGTLKSKVPSSKAVSKVSLCLGRISPVASVSAILSWSFCRIVRLRAFKDPPSLYILQIALSLISLDYYEMDQLEHHELQKIGFCMKLFVPARNLQLRFQEHVGVAFPLDLH